MKAIPPEGGEKGKGDEIDPEEGEFVLMDEMEGEERVQPQGSFGGGRKIKSFISSIRQRSNSGVFSSSSSPSLATSSGTPEIFEENGSRVCFLFDF